MAEKSASSSTKKEALLCSQRLVLTLRQPVDAKQSKQLILSGIGTFPAATLPTWKLKKVDNGRGAARWVKGREKNTLMTFVRQKDDKTVMRAELRALAEEAGIEFAAEGFTDVVATPARAPSAEPAAPPTTVGVRRKRAEDDDAGGGARARRRLTPPPSTETETGAAPAVDVEGITYEDFDGADYRVQRRRSTGSSASPAAGRRARRRPAGVEGDVMTVHGVRIVECRAPPGGVNSGGGGSSSDRAGPALWWELQGANTRRVLRQLGRARDDAGAPLFRRAGRAERWRSTGPLDRPERDYVKALVRTGCARSGWDGEVVPVPKRFRPRNRDGSRMGGPFRCGRNAMPHNLGRWFFKRNDGEGILWADGTEPFSEANQARFRAYAARRGGNTAALRGEYERRGYSVVSARAMNIEERPQWYLEQMFSRGQWGGLMSQNPLSLSRGPGY